MTRDSSTTVSSRSLEYNKLSRRDLASFGMTTGRMQL
jgi:hypothetical protein